MEQQLKLGFFPKAYLYEFGDKGLVIEKERDNVTVYATSPSHADIFAAIPLGHPKMFKGLFFDIREADPSTLTIAVGNLCMVLDYRAGAVATNQQVQTYGSDFWGRPCDMPWTYAHSELF